MKPEQLAAIKALHGRDTKVVETCDIRAYVWAHTAHEHRHALIQYCEELEAKLDVFDEMDEMLRICLNANVDMAEKLDRVRGLPEKWRDISYKTTDAYTNLHGCADELQSALGDEDG